MPTKSKSKKGQRPSPVGRAASGSPATDGLKVEIRDKRLVISIGIKTLAWAAAGENGGPLEGWRIRRGREVEWAKDVAREMEHEDGDYNALSRVAEWVDEMINCASENGSGAQEKVNEPS